MSSASTLEKKASFKFVFSHPVHLLAFGFGSGLAVKAPGTVGTIAAIPLYWLCANLDLYTYLGLCILISLSGIYWCGYAAKALNTHDHPGIVWDEFAGFFICMIGFAATWQNILLGFIFFRFFDILKPWPIKWIDRHVSGGFGIMLDDVVAGILAWCCLYGVNYLWLIN